jgi:hypothetical protein
VATALDGGVRLTGATRYVALERAVAAARDRVLIGERGEERLLPRAQRFPRIAVVVGSGVVGSCGNEHRELPRAGLVAIVGEGRGVSSGDPVGELGSAAAVHDESHVEVVDGLREVLPPEKRLAGWRVPGRQERVRGDHAGEAIGVLGDQSQADQTSPVLADQRDVVQVERVEERRAHPLDVPRIRVVGAIGWLVGAPEPDEVGCNAAQPGGHERRDHLAVQEAPRRFAVHQEHDPAGAGTLVEVVHPEVVAIAGRHLDVVGREREVGERFESVIGRAQSFHRAPPRAAGA